MQDFVLGFPFSNIDPNAIVLIRKTRPKWQAGKLNGLGGKIDNPAESPSAAMIREFEEESGLTLEPVDLNHFATLEFKAARVFCFWFEVNIAEMETQGDEILAIRHAELVAAGKENTVENVPWLVARALEELRAGKELPFLSGEEL